MSIYSEWLKAKSAEKEAVATRRDLEDQMISALHIEENSEGSKSYPVEGFTVKITGRLNRKVDGDLLQEIAEESGLSEHLGTLFNWRPTINMKMWKASSADITKPLLEAITTTAGRPSVNITEL